MQYTPASAQLQSVHLLGEGYTSFKENELQKWWDLDSKETLNFPKNPDMILK